MWQPIETAPKDGTDVLIFGGGYMGVAWWCSEDDDLNEVDPFWAMYDGHDIIRAYRRELMNPTHWMPLPPHPQ